MDETDIFRFQFNLRRPVGPEDARKLLDLNAIWVVGPARLSKEEVAEWSEENPVYRTVGIYLIDPAIAERLGQAGVYRVILDSRGRYQ